MQDKPIWNRYTSGVHLLMRLVDLSAVVFFWSWLAEKLPRLLAGLSRESVAAAGLNTCGCLSRLKSQTLTRVQCPVQPFVRWKYVEGGHEMVRDGVLLKNAYTAAQKGK